MREREQNACQTEQNLLANYDFSKSFEYENGFYLTSEPYRIGNLLAHFELYKKILHLPGDVLEFGVFKGSSFIQFCTFRELLENERSRRIVGFDVFGNFPTQGTLPSDITFAAKWNEIFAETFISREDMECFIRRKGFNNTLLVEGDILSTLDTYLEQAPYTRIALLHIDTDVYEPCRCILERCWPRVINGGIVIFDDYATIEGETLAVDEFLVTHNLKLLKFPFSHSKPSYVVKEYHHD